MDFAKMIDHTLLKTDATKAGIDQLRPNSIISLPFVSAQSGWPMRQSSYAALGSRPARSSAFHRARRRQQ